MAVQQIDQYSHMRYWDATKLFFADEVNKNKSILFAGSIARKVWLVLSPIVIANDVTIPAWLASMVMTGPLGGFLAAAATADNAVAWVFIPITLFSITKNWWKHNRRLKKLVRQSQQRQVRGRR